MLDIHRTSTCPGTISVARQMEGMLSTARAERGGSSNSKRDTLLSTWPVTIGYGAGEGTLPWAIDNANKGNGPDTIDIQVSDITLNSAVPNLSDTTGLTQIKAHEGTSPTVARGSDPLTPEFRIFTIDAGVKAELDGLTVTGGLADQGGGINNQGDLTVTNCIVSGNNAGPWGTVGGGIYNGGTLAIVGGRIDNNNAGISGGGVYNHGTLTVSGCSFDGNGAYDGGGLANYDGADAKIVFSTFAGNNTGAYGGAIRNASSATLTVDSCILKGNTAGATGGAILNGFDNPDSVASVVISSCTIEGNHRLGLRRRRHLQRQHCSRSPPRTIDGNSADRGGGIFTWGRLGRSTPAPSSAIPPSMGGVAMAAGSMVVGRRTDHLLHHRR